MEGNVAHDAHLFANGEWQFIGKKNKTLGRDKYLKKCLTFFRYTKIRQKVEENLHICYIKHAKNDHFKSGKGLGNHSKYFIVDDLCSYTGSQNIYVCDLAEWGVIVDDSVLTAKILQDYWRPL